MRNEEKNEKKSFSATLKREADEIFCHVFIKKNMKFLLFAL
jgi:hypothetical protein